MEDVDSLEQLIRLLNLPDKRSVEKFCREITVTKRDLADFVIGARMGAMTPYQYACHFDQRVPAHLLPTDEDNGALVHAKLGGGSARRANKFARKVSQLFLDRRMLCCHLLFDPSKTRWHLFYFDQRDMDHPTNHWKKGGAHIHYSRESYVNKSLDEVWEDVLRDPPKLPSAEHIRFVDTRERGFVGTADTLSPPSDIAWEK